MLAGATRRAVVLPPGFPRLGRPDARRHERGQEELSLEKKVGDARTCSHALITVRPYQRVSGSKLVDHVFEFGSMIMFRVLGKVQGGSMQESWYPGGWLRKRLRAHEHLVMKDDGLTVWTRAVHRMTQVECFVLEVASQEQWRQGLPRCAQRSTSALNQGAPRSCATWWRSLVSRPDSPSAGSSHSAAQAMKLWDALRDVGNALRTLWNMTGCCSVAWRLPRSGASATWRCT